MLFGNTCASAPVGVANTADATIAGKSTAIAPAASKAPPIRRALAVSRFVSQGKAPDITASHKPPLDPSYARMPTKMLP